MNTTQTYISKAQSALENAVIPSLKKLISETTKEVTNIAPKNKIEQSDLIVNKTLEVIHHINSPIFSKTSKLTTTQVKNKDKDAEESVADKNYIFM